MPDDDRAVVSLASEAIDLAAYAGLELDPWQCLVMETMLSVREETYHNKLKRKTYPKWAASEFGLVVARQNGKGSILEARELAGLLLFGEEEIIHSAHLFDTSQKHFERIKQLIEGRPDFEAKVLRISNSHGAEGIYLRSGQKLIFKARSGGNSRGFSADLIVYDEAMLKLGTDEVEASLPAASARPNSQLLYFGSAGTQVSEHFGRARNRALRVMRGEKQEIRFGFMEWSAEICDDFCPPDCDEHDDPADPRTWAKANPAMGFRPGLTEEYIRETEIQAMSPAGFAKERLSVGDWPVEGGGWKIIPQDAWQRRQNESSEIVGKFALAVASAPDSTWTCIAAVGANADNDAHVEITGLDEIDYRQGIKWAVERVVAIWKAAKPPFVIIDPSNPAGSMIDELESRGVKVMTLTVRDYAQACGDVKNGVAAKPGEKANITHINQAPLNTAVASAEKKEVKDLWYWFRTESAADITPLIAITIGYWGFKKHIFKKAAAPFAFYA